MHYLLLAFLMSPIYATRIMPPFTLCTEESSQCQARKVHIEAYERKLKAEPECDEITALNEGVRSLIYYECRVLINEGEAALKLKIQPYKPKTR